MEPKIRVLIVDDSAVYREFLAHLLSSDPQITIAGAVRDGEAALEAVATLHPDVITMDINMPGMDGYDVTRRIMGSNPTPIIIVSGAAGVGEVQRSFRAMESGAVAVALKPRGGDSPESVAQSRELILTVKLMAEVKVVRRWSLKPSIPEPKAGSSRAGTSAPRRQGQEGRETSCDAILIGASAGGPLPLRTILSALPVGFPAAVLVVQHIAAGFVDGFAQWLGGSCRLPVRVAVEREPVVPGHVYVAPDGSHMVVREGPGIALLSDAPENGLRPSVSHLFRSGVSVYGSRAVGILLSGMGSDGAEELKALRDTGAVTFAQDRESCVVFGMPGEAVRMGGATYTMPPDAIAAAIVTLALTRNVNREMAL